MGWVTLLKTKWIQCIKEATTGNASLEGATLTVVLEKEAELLILKMYQKQNNAEEVLILFKEKESSVLKTSHICRLDPLFEQKKIIVCWRTLGKICFE